MRFEVSLSNHAGHHSAPFFVTAPLLPSFLRMQEPRSPQGGAPSLERSPSKPGTVTIHGRPGEEVRRGTWKSIMRQAGLDEQE